MINKAARPCAENQETQEFFQCIKQDYITKLNLQGLTCLPIFLYNLLSKEFPQFSLCQNEEKVGQSYVTYSDLIVNYTLLNQEELKCRNPCITETLTTLPSTLKVTGEMLINNLRRVLIEINRK